MSIDPERTTMAAAKFLFGDLEKRKLGIRSAASVAILVLVAACSDSLGGASDGTVSATASSQRTAVKDLALNERSERRLAPPASSEITAEVPNFMSRIGTSADDGGYQYYELANGAR